MSTTEAPVASEEKLVKDPTTNTALINLQKLIPSAKMERMKLDDIFAAKEENIRQMDKYDEDKIVSLAASIEAIGGLLQPLTVLPMDPCPENGNRSYALQTGYRRFFALKYLRENVDPKYGEEVPVIVTDEADSFGTQKLVQLIENEQREGLNPIERALAIRAALDDSETKFTQREVAKVIGISEGAVSHVLKLLKLPKGIQDKISNGLISFSHAKIIIYLPEEHWQVAADAAVGTDYDDFKGEMERLYGKKATAEAGGDATVSTGNSSPSQKPAQLLRVSEIEKVYLPFLQGRIKEANNTEKLYTAQDVEKARMDAIQTVMRNQETMLSKVIAPEIEKQKAAEEAEKLNKEAVGKADKFYRDAVKRVIDIGKAPIDPNNPDAKRPTAAEIYGLVAGEIMNLHKAEKAEELKALGFTLDTDVNDVVKKITVTHATMLKEAKERKEAADKRKAEAAAEEAKKAAEANTASTPNPAAPAVDSTATAPAVIK